MDIPVTIYPLVSLEPGTVVLSDALACFGAVQQTGQRQGENEVRARAAICAYGSRDTACEPGYIETRTNGTIGVYPR